MARTGGYRYGMKSKDYWTQRSKEQLSESFDDARKVEIYYHNVFKNSLLKLTNDYGKLIRIFELPDGSIDYDALTKAYYYDKEFRQKKDRIEQEIYLFTKQMKDSQSKDILAALEKIYVKNVETIYKEFQVTTDGLALLDSRAVRKAVTTPFTTDGREFSDRIWTNLNRFDMSIRSELSRSIANGDSIVKTSKRFQEIYGNTAYNTQRLIRTETLACYAKSSIDSYKELGVDELVILTEGSFCSICEEYKDTTLSVDEAEVGVNIPPFHPNCKCCVAPLIKTPINI